MILFKRSGTPSGVVRNHSPELMIKAFEIRGMINRWWNLNFQRSTALRGAPLHAGIAPGVDRIIMLLADEPNIREVIAFPMNQKAQDLLMAHLRGGL